MNEGLCYLLLLPKYAHEDAKAKLNAWPMVKSVIAYAKKYGIRPKQFFGNIERVSHRRIHISQFGEITISLRKIVDVYGEDVCIGGIRGAPIRRTEGYNTRAQSKRKSKEGSSRKLDDMLNRSMGAGLESLIDGQRMNFGMEREFDDISNVGNPNISELAFTGIKSAVNKLQSCFKQLKNQVFDQNTLVEKNFQQGAEQLEICTQTIDNNMLIVETRLNEIDYTHNWMKLALSTLTKRETVLKLVIAIVFLFSIMNTYLLATRLTTKNAVNIAAYADGYCYLNLFHKRDVGKAKKFLKEWPTLRKVKNFIKYEDITPKIFKGTIVLNGNTIHIETGDTEILIGELIYKFDKDYIIGGIGTINKLKKFVDRKEIKYAPTVLTEYVMWYYFRVLLTSKYLFIADFVVDIFEVIVFERTYFREHNSYFYKQINKNWNLHNKDLNTELNLIIEAMRQKRENPKIFPEEDYDEKPGLIKFEPFRINYVKRFFSTEGLKSILNYFQSIYNVIREFPNIFASMFKRSERNALIDKYTTKLTNIICEPILKRIITNTKENFKSKQISEITKPILDKLEKSNENLIVKIDISIESELTDKKALKSKDKYEMGYCYAYFFKEENAKQAILALGAWPSFKRVASWALVNEIEIINFIGKATIVDETRIHYSLHGIENINFFEQRRSYGANTLIGGIYDLRNSNLQLSTNSWFFNNRNFFFIIILQMTFKFQLFRYYLWSTLLLLNFYIVFESYIDILFSAYLIMMLIWYFKFLNVNNQIQAINLISYKDQIVMNFLKFENTFYDKLHVKNGVDISFRRLYKYYCITTPSVLNPINFPADNFTLRNGINIDEEQIPLLAEDLNDNDPLEFAPDLLIDLVEQNPIIATYIKFLNDVKPSIVVKTKKQIVKNINVSNRIKGNDCNWLNEAAQGMNLIYNKESSSPHVINEALREIVRANILKQIMPKKRVLVVGSNVSAWPLDGFVHCIPNVDIKDSSRSFKNDNFIDNCLANKLAIEFIKERLERIDGKFDYLIILHVYDIPIESIIFHALRLGVSTILLGINYNLDMLLNESGILPAVQLRFKKRVVNNYRSISFSHLSEESFIYEHNFDIYYNLITKRIFKIGDNQYFCGDVMTTMPDNTIIIYNKINSSCMENRSLNVMNYHSIDCFTYKLFNRIEKGFFINNVQFEEILIPKKLFFEILGSVTGNTNIEIAHACTAIIHASQQIDNDRTHPIFDKYIEKIDLKRLVFDLIEFVKIEEKLKIYQQIFSNAERTLSLYEILNCILNSEERSRQLKLSILRNKVESIIEETQIVIKTTDLTKLTKYISSDEEFLKQIPDDVAVFEKSEQMQQIKNKRFYLYIIIHILSFVVMIYILNFVKGFIKIPLLTFCGIFIILFENGYKSKAVTLFKNITEYISNTEYFITPMFQTLSVQATNDLLDYTKLGLPTNDLRFDIMQNLESYNKSTHQFGEFIETNLQFLWGVVLIDPINFHYCEINKAIVTKTDYLMANLPIVILYKNCFSHKLSNNKNDQKAIVEFDGVSWKRIVNFNHDTIIDEIRDTGKNFIKYINFLHFLAIGDSIVNCSARDYCLYKEISGSTYEQWIEPNDTCCTVTGIVNCCNRTNCSIIFEECIYLTMNRPLIEVYKFVYIQEGHSYSIDKDKFLTYVRLFATVDIRLWSLNANGALDTIATRENELAEISITIDKLHKAYPSNFTNSIAETLIYNIFMEKILLGRFKDLNLKDNRNLKRAMSEFYIYDTQIKLFINNKPPLLYNYCWDGDKFISISEYLNNDSLEYTGSAQYLYFSEDINFLRERNLVDNVKLNLEKIFSYDYSRLQFTLIDGVPGCGKTSTVIKLSMRNVDLVCTTTRIGKEEYLLKTNGNQLYYRTYDSCLINPVPNVITLWADEGLMIHCGDLLIVANFCNCKYIKVYGDSLQIPFINRIIGFEMKFHKYPFVSKELQTVTHRSPISMMKILQQFYPTISTTSDKLGSITIEKIRILTPITINCDVVLTLTQYEKHEVGKLNKHLKVMTVHESQGLKFNTVIVYRFISQENAIYKSKPHLIVAISRHTENLIYITTDTSDLLSKILKGHVTHNEFSTEKYSLIKLINCNHAVPPKRLVCKKTWKFTEKIENNVLIWHLRNTFLGSLNSFVSYHVEYISEEIRKDNFSINYEIQTIQFIVDKIYDRPSVKARNMFLLKFNNLEYIPEVSINITKLIRMESKKQVTKNQIVYLTPKLITPQPLRFKNSLVEILNSIKKRNLNPPIQHYTRETSLVELISDKFFETYINNDQLNRCKQVFDYDNKIFITDWLNSRNNNRYKRLISTKLQDMNYDIYASHLKPDAKPILDNSHNIAPPAGQIVTAHDPTITFKLCGVARCFSTILKSSLKPNFKINDGITKSMLEGHINKILLNTSKFFPLEIDFSKFDKSQEELALSVSCEIMTRMGVPKYFVTLWYEAHLINKLVFHNVGIKVSTKFQRRSGDILTFVLNTLVSMFSISFCYNITNTLGGVFGGDDSIIYFKEDETLVDKSKSFNEIFNLEAKIEFFGDAMYFSSKFIIQVNQIWRVISDPIKCIVRLGRHDMYCKEHIECYYISFCDNYKDYKNILLRSKLVEIAQIRYKNKFKSQDVNIKIIIEFINSLLFNKAKFLNLYSGKAELWERKLITQMRDEFDHVQFYDEFEYK